MAYLSSILSGSMPVQLSSRHSDLPVPGIDGVCMGVLLLSPLLLQFVRLWGSTSTSFFLDKFLFLLRWLLQGWPLGFSSLSSSGAGLLLYSPDFTDSLAHVGPPFICFLLGFLHLWFSLWSSLLEAAIQFLSRQMSVVVRVGVCIFLSRLYHVLSQGHCTAFTIYFTISPSWSL